MPRLRSGAGPAGAARAVSGAPGPAGRGGRAAVPGGPRDLCADGQDVDRRAAPPPRFPGRPRRSAQRSPPPPLQAPVAHAENFAHRSQAATEDEKVTRLADMGFSRVDAIAALQSTANDENAALELLLSAA